MPRLPQHLQLHSLSGPERYRPHGFAVTSGYVVGLNGEQLTETDGGTGWLHTRKWATARDLLQHRYAVRAERLAWNQAGGRRGERM